MATATLNDISTVQANLAKWIEADAALAAGKSVNINGRQLTRANAREVRTQINYWSRLEGQLLQRQASTKDQSRANHGLAKFG